MTIAKLHEIRWVLILELALSENIKIFSKTLVGLISLFHQYQQNKQSHLTSYCL